MTIKTKCIRDPVDRENDGLRVLIMRNWPQGIEWPTIDVRCLALSPSKELLKKWKVHKSICIKKNDLPAIENGWQEFTTFLNLEFNENPQVDHMIRKLREINKVSDITLLCEEKDDDPYCHRYIVKDLIENSKN